MYNLAKCIQLLTDSDFAFHRRPVKKLILPLCWVRSSTEFIIYGLVPDWDGYWEANISLKRAEGDIDFFFVYLILFLLRSLSAASVTHVCLEAKILTEIFDGKNYFYNEITFFFFFKFLYLYFVWLMPIPEFEFTSLSHHGR